MPALVVEQRRIFNKRPLCLLIDSNYHKPMAAPLYEIKGRSANRCEQFIRDWLDHLIVQEAPITIPSGVRIVGKGHRATIIRRS